MRISQFADAFFVGIDPGTNGSIVVTQAGRIIEMYPFNSHVKHVGINKLMCLDASWLNKVLNSLKKYSSSLNLETPKVTTYAGWNQDKKKPPQGKISVKTIVALQQQVAQLYHASVTAGFEVTCADPQNWQGYHGLFAYGKKSVKDVVMDTFVQWHQENEPTNAVFQQVMSLPKDQRSGVADAWAIAQYVYQEPPEREERRSNKVKIVQPKADDDFVMF